MTEKLKPCTFCGGEADVSQVAVAFEGMQWWVRCSQCSAMLQRITEMKDLAVAAWQTRVESSKCRQLFLMCQAYEFLFQTLEPAARHVPGLARQLKSKEFIRVREDLNAMLLEDAEARRRESAGSVNGPADKPEAEHTGPPCARPSTVRPAPQKGKSDETRSPDV